MLNLETLLEWIEHDGTCCPFELGDFVLVRHRNLSVSSFQIYEANFRKYIWDDGVWSCFTWAVNGRPVVEDFIDIIAYKIQKEKAENQIQISEKILNPTFMRFS